MVFLFNLYAPWKPSHYKCSINTVKNGMELLQMYLPFYILPENSPKTSENISVKLPAPLVFLQMAKRMNWKCLQHKNTNMR